MLDLWADDYTGSRCRLYEENKNNDCQYFKKKIFAPKPEVKTPTQSIIYCCYCRHWKG